MKNVPIVKLIHCENIPGISGKKQSSVKCLEQILNLFFNVCLSIFRFIAQARLLSIFSTIPFLFVQGTTPSFSFGNQWKLMVLSSV